MIHLLDVNVLLAAIWENHSLHSRTSRWLQGKRVAVCPLVELGFIRISTNPKVINAPMKQTRQLLERFISERDAQRIPDDLPALESHADSSEHVTDNYLAALAASHKLKFATLDERVRHPSAVLVS